MTFFWFTEPLYFLCADGRPAREAVLWYRLFVFIAQPPTTLQSRARFVGSLSSVARQPQNIHSSTVSVTPQRKTAQWASGKGLITQRWVIRAARGFPQSWVITVDMPLAFCHMADRYPFADPSNCGSHCCSCPGHSADRDDVRRHTLEHNDARRCASMHDSARQCTAIRGTARQHAAMHGCAAQCGRAANATTML